MNRTYCVLLLTILVGGLSLVGVVPVCAESSGVIIVINSDTIWTSVDSPYNLTGPLLVEQGATLTIDPGTTINLNGYDVQIRGTFVAVGTSIAPINITETLETKNISPDSNPFGRLEFTSSSNGWNKQLASGCVFDNVFIENVDIISAVSLKISNSRIRGDLTVDDYSIISDSYIAINNRITNGKITIGGSSEVTNNELIGPIHFENSNTISNNALKGSVTAGSSNTISCNNISSSVYAGSFCSILNNTIKGIVEASESTISNNKISHTVSYYGDIFRKTTHIIDPGPAIKVSGTSRISDNIISGQEDYVGIEVNSGSFYISANTVTDAGTAIRAQGGGTIQENLLVNNKNGIVVPSAGDLTIHDNIVVNGTVGIATHGNVVIIEKNLVSNHLTTGIDAAGSSTVIRNNTINNNTVGIRSSASSLTVNYNNLENNQQNSIYLENNSDEADATNNWWGTTDTKQINMSIYDGKYAFNLDKVNFVPFLTEPNPNAKPEYTPTIPEFPVLTFLPFTIIGTFVLVLYKHKIHKLTSKGSHLCAVY
ncbi:MAG: hypothetical protein CW691_01680 [Candidatus Bathyarchaeum sp.]|nr:MAG: hypothetical protein CW691_01680 [Candidatus Bathyarchaeum sp.]